MGKHVQQTHMHTDHFEVDSGDVVRVKVLTGTAAPTTVPPYIGAEYIDTTNKKVYKAIGTTEAGDWELLNDTD